MPVKAMQYKASSRGTKPRTSGPRPPTLVASTIPATVHASPAIMAPSTVHGIRLEREPSAVHGIRLEREELLVPSRLALFLTERCCGEDSEPHNRWSISLSTL